MIRSIPLPDRRGFTLVELVASLIGASVLVAGLGSSILIAVRACDPNLTPAVPTLDGATALTELQSDLLYAIAISERTATSITVTVPDRNDDGNPESIRYSWSGTPGDPLTRQLNAGAVAIFAQDVRAFQLEYDLRTFTRPGPPLVVEHAETTLASNTSAFFMFLDDWKVTDNQATGQFIAPALPSNTRSWKVTRVRFKALKADSPTNDSTNVQLRPADGNALPTTDVVESLAMSESPLGTSHTWKEFSYSGVSGLLPSQNLCLTLTTTSTNGSCRVQYETLSGMGGLLKWNGSYWIRELLQTLMFEVLGCVTTSTPTTVDVEVVAGVNVQLQLSGWNAARVDSAIQPLNLPESQ